MHEDTSKRMLSYMEAHTEEMVELQRLLTSHPALSPEVGGRGEWEKAQVLVEWLGPISCAGRSRRGRDTISAMAVLTIGRVEFCGISSW